MILIRNLSKNFGGVLAVDSINLDIRQGELFGILGPNGAGKTTIINMLATMTKPSSGTVHMEGVNLIDHDAIRKLIGIVFQDPSLDDELTAIENLEFHGRLYHLSKCMRKARMRQVLRLVDLEPKANTLVKSFSGGMKRRLEIARGLIHFPKVLFLDEPTIGLDPQTRRNIWHYIKELNKNEKITIILTTHYMEEADSLCDRVAIIDQGKIIALDAPTNLKSSVGGDTLTFECSNVDDFIELIREFEGIKEVKKLNEKSFRLRANDGAKLLSSLLKLAVENRFRIDSVKLENLTLEDVFIHYTGKNIRDEKASDVDRMRTIFKATRK